MTLPPLPDDSARKTPSGWDRPLADRDVDLDALCRRAAALFRVPMAVIWQQEDERLVILGRFGVEDADVQAENVFCRAAMPTGKPFVVSDATRDPRFRSTNPVIAMKVCFYASVPLCNKPGGRFGTLCIADSVPRNFSTADLALLERLAARAASEVWARLATTEPGRILLD